MGMVSAARTIACATGLLRRLGCLLGLACAREVLMPGRGAPAPELLTPGCLRPVLQRQHSSNSHRECCGMWIYGRMPFVMGGAGRPQENY